MLRHHGVAVSLLAALLSAACGDDAPVGVPSPCFGTCVRTIDLTVGLLALTPGDSVRLHARATTAEGAQVPVRWRAETSGVRVDSLGNVVALEPGHSFARGVAATDSTKLAFAELWIVDPDTSAQPLIATFLNAATGDTLIRRYRFAGVDSVDVVISYVLGYADAPADASARLEVHPYGVRRQLASFDVPLPIRGRGALATKRLRLTEPDSAGRRRFPGGAYDLFVVLTLSDGRELGGSTGYPISF